MDNISEFEKEQIVTAGLDLMSAMTAAYGAERGIAVWDAFGTAVGADFKNEIFMEIMKGRVTNKISLHWTPTSSNHFVEIIKEIRMVTGWALKYAKDFVDELRSKDMIITLGPDVNRKEFCRAMSHRGVVCS